MIAPQKFTPRASRWQDIVACLKEHGIEVRSPGVEIGDVTKKFVIVTYYGASSYLTYSSEKAVYDVTVYIPRANYSELEPYIQQVKDAMEDLRPMLKLNGYESPSFYDDTIKAHVVDIEYSAFRTFNGRSRYYG